MIGVPDEKWGEAIKAVIELKPDATVEPEAIIALCKENLGSVKAPKTVDFWDELPRSPVGKVRKKDIRDTFWQGASAQNLGSRIMNIAYILTQSARAYCDRPAVCLGVVDVQHLHPITGRSAALAAALKQRNLVKGDRVLIFMGNRPEYIEILFAIWTAGCVAVPLNAKLHPNEVTYIHANCDAALAFTDRPEDVEGFSAVIAVGGPEYNAALQASADLQPAHAAQTDPAWIFFIPAARRAARKGAILTHRNLWTMTTSFLADMCPVTEMSAALHPAPLSHAAGLFMLPFAQRGAANVVPQSGGFDPHEIVTLLHEYPHSSFFCRTHDADASDGLSCA